MMTELNLWKYLETIPTKYNQKKKKKEFCKKICKLFFKDCKNS